MLRHKFNLFDENGDGYLTADEIAGILMHPGGGAPLSMEDARRFISWQDTNRDGKLSLDELCASMTGGLSAFAAMEMVPSVERERTKPDDILLLGLTLETLREQINRLPANAITRAKRLNPKHTALGKNGVDGYTNQELIKERTKRNALSVCRELQLQGHKGVGKATHFLSWWLGSNLEELLTALEAYEERFPQREPRFWWVCDFSFNQNAIKGDAKLAEDMKVNGLRGLVREIGHTVLFLDPWHKPTTVTRIWCIWELLTTQLVGAKFDVATSDAQAQSFVAALSDAEESEFGYDALGEAMSRIDVRSAVAYDPEDTKRMMMEVERLGAGAVNTLVSREISKALATLGRVALERLPLAERGVSALLCNLGSLLHDQGELDAALPLLRESVQCRRQALGDKHDDTLDAIYDLARLLHDRGDWDGAKTLVDEALAARVAAHTHRHDDTLKVANLLGKLLKDQGELGGAKMILKMGERVGREMYYSPTLEKDEENAPSLYTLLDVFGNLGSVLKEKGELEAAAPLLREALKLSREENGQRATETLEWMDALGSLLQAQGDLEGASALLDEAMQTGRETLGSQHKRTLVSINSAGKLRQAKGEWMDAEILMREALEARRQTLGNTHPETLDSMDSLASLLMARAALSQKDRPGPAQFNLNTQGIRQYQELKRKDLEAAEALLSEASMGRKEALGEKHPKTHKSVEDLKACRMRQTVGSGSV